MALGVIALLGSGEIAPSMTKVHRQLMKPLGEVRAVNLDTPYGFQTNVPQMTAKIRDYFATSLRVPIRTLHFPSYDDAGPVEREIVRQEVREANYVFAGPGSPSWAVKQWSPLGLTSDLAEVVRAGGVVCFASAAALTVGALTAPIYEIYKAGTVPYWLNGLDLLAIAGLRTAVIPHYNNAEGGNYDTRHCYLGEHRLLTLESQLPADVGILGVDEHTAAIIDLEQRTLSVLGKGSAYWRHQGATQVLNNATSTPLGTLQTLNPVKHAPTTMKEPFNDLENLVRVAQTGGPTSIEAIAALARRAAQVNSNVVDAPAVVTRLVSLRSQLRQAQDFEFADQVRTILYDLGFDVTDSPDGPTWSPRK